MNVRKNLKSPKKVRVGRKPSTLAKAIDNMSPEALRDFVQQVAERVLVDTDDSDRCFLNPNKDLEGADTIEFLSNLLERAGLWPKGR